MTTTLREAAQQALEALKSCSAVPHWPALQPTITALRDALAQEDEMREMLRTLGFDSQCPESIGITLRRWRDGYAAALAQEEPRRTGLPHCERSCEANAFQIEIRRLKAELAAEREACAELVEGMDVQHPKYIAAAIRARSKT